MSSLACLSGNLLQTLTSILRVVNVASLALTHRAVTPGYYEKQEGDTEGSTKTTSSPFCNRSNVCDWSVGLLVGMDSGWELVYVGV